MYTLDVDDMYDHRSIVYIELEINIAQLCCIITLHI
jgi:hypothetical protein